MLKMTKLLKDKARFLKQRQSLIPITQIKILKGSQILKRQCVTSTARPLLSVIIFIYMTSIARSILSGRIFIYTQYKQIIQEHQSINFTRFWTFSRHGMLELHIRRDPKKFFFVHLLFILLDNFIIC